MRDPVKQGLARGSKMAAKHFAYLRHSTSSQSISPIRQRELIDTWAKKNKIIIDEWYCEEPITGSASIQDRPVLTELLVRIGKKDSLVVLDITRLARSQLVFNMVLGMLHTKSAQLKFADGTTYEEDFLYSRLMMSVMAFASEWEKQAIAVRTKTALQVIGKTKALGAPTRCKYGWSNVGGLLKVNDEEQEVGKRIKEMRAQGCTFRAIEERLAKAGIKNRAGKVFSNAGIQHINRTFRAA